MWLTNVSIRRPVFIIMFVLALIVLGYQSRSRMPAELYPKMDFPYVTVRTTYPGAGPTEIETLVSEPIEKAVASIGNLRNVTSSSQDGISAVALEFELGTNLEAAAADVRDKVSAIRAQLPKEIDEPVILKLDIAAEPVMTIGLAGPLSPKEMKILADDVISDRLAKVGGVAAVNVTGGEDREISVAVDKDRLQAYAIGMDKVVSAINLANLNVPAGSIKQGSRDYSIRTVGEFASADEIANVRIHVAGKSGNPDVNIRVGDIATITDTVAEPDYLSRLNGQPGVLLTIQKQSDANTVGVAEGIKKQLAELKPILPAGVKSIVANDQSKFVEDALTDVNKSLMEGVILVVIIVFLFLHSTRATFIVAIAIPTSIMATYTPIHAFGFTVNMMVMLALSLVVGILVDDSIVILENIERHIRLREKPAEAALSGRSEIGLAAIAITFVDIVVFVPIAFMGGIVGQFFKQFGLTVAVATAFSLFMSFTLTPMLAARWLKSEEESERDEAEIERRLRAGTASLKTRFDAGFGRVFGGLEHFLSGLNRHYRTVLEWALHNRFLVWVIGSMSLLVVFAMAMPIKGPTMGMRVFVALLTLILCGIAMAIDSRSWKVALGFGAVMAFIALTIYLPFGFNFFPDVDRGYVTATIRTAPGTSLRATDEVVRKVEAVIRPLPEIKPVEYWVSDGLFKKHKEIDRGYYMSYVGMSAAGHFGGADIGPQHARIDVQLLDKTRAAYFDMSTAQVALAARTAIDGDDTAKLRDGDTEYPIRVRFAAVDRSKPSDVEGLIVGSRDGAPIYLRDVANVEYDNAPTKIDRKNRQRVVYVTANLAAGMAQGNIERAIDMASAKAGVLSGTTVKTGGTGQMMAESFGYMGSALLLAILLVYMLMGALFESFLTPFVIMFSLPQAMVGALLALLLTGNTLSVVAMIGIIMLMGLVTKNAILLVDYTNTLRERGKSRHDAILEAGPTRLRPILMTTLAMIGGMTPTALAISRGAEMRAPMAIAVIGGLILSTMLTLIVIPVTYTIVDDVWQGIKRRVMPGAKHVELGEEAPTELAPAASGSDTE